MQQTERKDVPVSVPWLAVCGDLSSNVTAPTLSPEIRALFDDNPKIMQGIHEVETRAAELVRLFCRTTDFPDRKFLEQGKEPLFNIFLTQLTRLQSAYGRRLGTSYCDALEALGRRRLNLASLALRAYLELSGALVYYEKRISVYFKSYITTNDQVNEVLELFNGALLGGRFQWEKFIIGGEDLKKLKIEYEKAHSSNKEPDQQIRQKSVTTFISELDTAFENLTPGSKGIVKMFYALLSDICHPSVGGDLWFMDVPQVPCHLRHLAAPHDEMMREFIRRIALPIMVDITRTTEQALKKVYALADSLHKESIH